MVPCSIGTTRSGKRIVIGLGSSENARPTDFFAEFSNDDKFDAILAIEYVLLRETRRGFKDVPWTEALRFALDQLNESLNPDQRTTCRLALGLENAFQAREHGEKRVHKYFRLEP